MSFSGPYTASQSAGVVFVIPNNYRGIVTVHDSNENRNGLYMVFATGNGVIGVKAVSTASDITVVTSYANRVRLNPTSGSRVISVINVQGTATIQ